MLHVRSRARRRPPDLGSLVSPWMQSAHTPAPGLTRPSGRGPRCDGAGKAAARPQGARLLSVLAGIPVGAFAHGDGGRAFKFSAFERACMRMRACACARTFGLPTDPQGTRRAAAHKRLGRLGRLGKHGIDISYLLSLNRSLPAGLWRLLTSVISVRD